MICVFDARSTDWTGNGLAVLDASVCTVSETAGGSYELTLTHPCDDTGKWKYLTKEAIIKAPVPVKDVPAILGTYTEDWRVKLSAGTIEMYAKPLVYTYVNPPSASAWTPRAYTPGELASFGGKVWRYTGYDGEEITTAPGTAPYWQELVPSGYYTGGGVLKKLTAGTVVLKVDDYDSQWMKIQTMDGTEGYVRTASMEYYRTRTDPIPARSVIEQCFRVYKLAVDSANMAVTVNARHISYDLYGMVIGACSVKNASPATAISHIQASMLSEDIRTIATNISGEQITQDWSWKNAAFALLDPDAGLVRNARAQLIRDNNDFFLLQDTPHDTGYRIEYGGNMIGITWDIDVENVVTRIIPKCKKADDTPLFLPEQWIDAENASEFATTRMYVLECNYKVGDEYDDGEGTVIQSLTENDCYDLMRADVAKQYDEKKVNQAKFTLNVEFVNLGDTAEYAQFKGLQSLNLYDTVHIKHGPLGFESAVEMKAYTWDCINQRYNSAEFGDAFEDVGGTIPGYSLSSESISGSKLSPDAKNKLDTTYKLTRSGATIKLAGTDGSESSVTLPTATISAAGLMSAADKKEVNALTDTGNRGRGTSTEASLNSIQTAGVYKVTSSAQSTSSAWPSGLTGTWNGVLEVLDNGGGILLQRLTVYASGSYTDYKRVKDGSWQSWA